MGEKVADMQRARGLVLPKMQNLPLMSTAAATRPMPHRIVFQLLHGTVSIDKFIQRSAVR